MLDTAPKKCCCCHVCVVMLRVVQQAPKVVKTSLKGKMCPEEILVCKVDSTKPRHIDCPCHLRHHCYMWYIDFCEYCNVNDTCVHLQRKRQNGNGTSRM